MSKITLSLAVAFFAFAAFPEVKLLEPSEGAVVALLTDSQKAYVKMTREERRGRFADSSFRRKQMGLPAELVPGEKRPREAFWPKTVRLAWSAKAGADCTVSVLDVKKGACVYRGVVKGDSVVIDNLEIAAEYEWTVDDGEGKATAKFFTESLAPRLVRFPGVPNVRDLGGRVGLGGKRVRQGLVFRSAGLNDNAGKAYYTKAELEAKGVLPELDKKAAEMRRRLEQLQAWQKAPATMDREDKEYKDWCGRHPSEPVTKFLSSRIQRAQATIDNKDFKIEKNEQVPGKSRVEGEKGEYIRTRFGIRSDIDLRSDRECFGMTGSPLGATVAWHHYSSSAYGGMQSEGGRDAFKKVFKVFLDRDNYPIDFHCIAGQDRTGAVAFILNALLGVEEDQLYLDWEVTGFWNRSSAFNHEKLFDHLVKGFVRQHPAPTIQESVEKYVLSLGFTTEDIATFRGIMLEEK